MLAAPLLVSALWACAPARDDADGISADDQRQLNDAAAMLDSNSLDPDLLANHESSPHD